MPAGASVSAARAARSTRRIRIRGIGRQAEHARRIGFALDLLDRLFGQPTNLSLGLVVQVTGARLRCSPTAPAILARRTGLWVMANARRRRHTLHCPGCDWLARQALGHRHAVGRQRAARRAVTSYENESFSPTCNAPIMTLNGFIPRSV